MCGEIRKSDPIPQARSQSESTPSPYISQATIGKRMNEHRCRKCGRKRHQIKDCRSDHYTLTPPPQDLSQLDSKCHKSDEGQLKIMDYDSEISEEE